jgi:hypothetical protein
MDRWIQPEHSGEVTDPEPVTSSPSKKSPPSHALTPRPYNTRSRKRARCESLKTSGHPVTRSAPIGQTTAPVPQLSRTPGNKGRCKTPTSRHPAPDPLAPFANPVPLQSASPSLTAPAPVDTVLPRITIPHASQRSKSHAFEPSPLTPHNPSLPHDSPKPPATKGAITFQRNPDNGLIYIRIPERMIVLPERFAPEGDDDCQLLRDFLSAPGSFSLPFPDHVVLEYLRARGLEPFSDRFVLSRAVGGLMWVGDHQMIGKRPLHPDLVMPVTRATTLLACMKVFSRSSLFLAAWCQLRRLWVERQLVVLYACGCAPHVSHAPHAGGMVPRG